MNMVLFNLAEKLLEEVKYLILEVAEIPESALIEYGSVGFECFSYSLTEFKAEEALKFDKLCSMAPGIPRACVEKLIYAFQLLTPLVCGDNCKSIDEEDFALLFMEASRSVGMGEVLLPTLPFSEAEKNRRLFAEAGLKGAEIRHKPYRALIGWALAEAAKLRGSDKDISRRLANSIPSHLANVSKEPDRLIYEALRKERASKKASRGPPVT